MLIQQQINSNELLLKIAVKQMRHTATVRKKPWGIQQNQPRQEKMVMSPNLQRQDELNGRRFIDIAILSTIFKCCRAKSVLIAS